MADRESSTRPQFGNRFLSDPTKVFEHNAWDDVEWDSDQEKAAQQKINENSDVKVDEDQQALYEDKAYSFWNEFYMQHQNRFFKDRHWLFTEFPELSGPDVPSLQCHYSSSFEEENISQLTSNTTKQSTKCTCEDFCTPSDTHGKPSCCCGLTNGKLRASNIKMMANDVTSENNTVGEFPGCQKKKRILEVGCGVGNTVFPILEANNSPYEYHLYFVVELMTHIDPDLFVYCCDFSSCAISLVKEHPDYDPNRCHAFVCDVTEDVFVFPFPAQSLDTVILIFVLSAVHPNKMQDVICRLSKLLKPGGLILFRDYGRFDMAQLRFKQGKCLSDNFYVRGDGTRVYFFTQGDLSRMFQEAGLVEEQNYVDRRLQVNRGRQLKMYRVWIQCKYRKPR